jgi:hypothetical protein
MTGQNDGHPIDRLPDLLLGELAPPEADAVLGHVAACPPCAEAWGRLEAAGGRLVDGLPREPAPEAARGRLLARVQADSARRARARRLLPLGAALAGAAAASIVWLVASMTAAPGQRLAVLVGRHGMGGSVYMDTSLHRATMRVWRLPRLPKGEVYEVWWSQDGRHVMGGSFGVDRMGDASITLAMPADWQQARTISVTMEPAPGTRAPTTAGLIAGPLSRTASAAQAT